MATSCRSSTRVILHLLRVRSIRSPSSTSAILPGRHYSQRHDSGFFSWGQRARQWVREQGLSRLARPLIITSASIPVLSQSRTDPSSTRLPSNVPIELSRIMLPDDTNSSGNVHGGTILKLIEHAGHIVANRHCNRNKPDASAPVTTVLVRVDHMDFHQPMYVGEVSQLQAAVTFTSPHSIEVRVDVWAENVITGDRRHTNEATLWYVAVPADVGNLLQPVPVPQLENLSVEERERGRKRYEAQKAARKAKSAENGTTTTTHRVDTIQYAPSGFAEEHTVMASQSTLANLILPSDCTLTGHLMGGSLMKQMDNAAGICAARHSKSRVVTACIDAIDFHSPIMNGEVVFVTARMVFASARSMEIEVTTEAEGLGARSRRITNTAYFTFVSLGKDKHATSIPSLKVRTPEERERFEKGRTRYEARKKLRKEAAAQWN